MIEDFANPAWAEHHGRVSTDLVALFAGANAGGISNVVVEGQGKDGFADMVGGIVAIGSDQGPREKVRAGSVLFGCMTVAGT